MTEARDKRDDGSSSRDPTSSFLRATAEAWESAFRQASRVVGSAPWFSPHLAWGGWSMPWFPSEPDAWWGSGGNASSGANVSSGPGLGFFGFPLGALGPGAPPLPGAELFLQIGRWWAGLLAQAAQEGPTALAQALSSEATEPLFAMWRQQLRQISDLAARLPLGPLFAQSQLAGTPLVGLSGALLQRLLGPWQEALQDLLSAWQRTLRGDADAFREFVHTWKETYDKTYGRLLQAPLVGYSREPAERFYRALDAYVDYLANVQEFAGVLERVGKVSMERWTAHLRELASGSSIPDHRQVYRLFIQTFESSYLEVFQSREYSRLQAQMVAAGLRFKRHLDRALEDAMSWLPVPTRSEVRDLYEAFYELRKRVRAQDRRIQHLETQWGSAPAPKPKKR